MATNHALAVPPAKQRVLFLDWLRVFAFMGLVIYHIGMYYVSWDFHVKSPFATAALVPWMKLTEPWRMSLIFTIAGAALAHMLKAGCTLRRLRSRTKFLLLPLLCGVVFVVPPQSYFEVLQKFSYQGSYLDFLALYFTHYQGFCDQGHCLILPTWNHLWFLPYLWVYTVLMFAVLAVSPSFLARLVAVSRYALAGPLLFLLPITAIFALRWLLFAQFPATHALIDDWFSHSIYFTMFLTGAIFASDSSVWSRLAGVRQLAFFMTFAFWTILVFMRPTGIFEHAVVATFQWSAVVAALGFARQYLNIDHPLRLMMNEAVFPIYILHQTVLIVGSQALLLWHLNPLVEAPLLLILTFSVSFLGYLLISKVALLRPCFGLRAPDRTNTPSARPQTDF